MSHGSRHCMSRLHMCWLLVLLYLSGSEYVFPIKAAGFAATMTTDNEKCKLAKFMTSCDENVRVSAKSRFPEKTYLWATHVPTHVLHTGYCNEKNGIANSCWYPITRGMEVCCGVFCNNFGGDWSVVLPSSMLKIQH